jgi:hypothetical protein
VPDVRLYEGGVLYGQVVNEENAPVSEADVVLRAAERQLATAKTDRSGRFAFRGLQSGVYRMSTTAGEGVYRVWNADVAPPAAGPQAILVSYTVRGQCGMHTFRNLMANPLVIAGIVAAAVAIPVALHNSKKSPASP